MPTQLGENPQALYLHVVEGAGGAMWDLFSKNTNSIHEVSTLMTLITFQSSHLIFHHFWGLGFRHMKFGSTQRFIPLHLASEKAVSFGSFLFSLFYKQWFYTCLLSCCPWKEDSMVILRQTYGSIFLTWLSLIVQKTFKTFTEQGRSDLKRQLTADLSARYNCFSKFRK